MLERQPEDPNRDLARMSGDGGAPPAAPPGGGAPGGGSGAPPSGDGDDDFPPDRSSAGAPPAIPSFGDDSLPEVDLSSGGGVPPSDAADVFGLESEPMGDDPFDDAAPESAPIEEPAPAPAPAPGPISSAGVPMQPPVDLSDVDVMAKHKAKVNPAALLLGMLVVLAGLGALIFSMQTSEQKLTVEQRMQTQADIFVLPEKEQITAWRKHAADAAGDEDLRCEALTQLGLLEDQEAIKLATDALATRSHKVRGTAAQVLAHFRADAKSATPALLKALDEAEESDERQLVWALVAVGEPSIFQKALDMYKAEKLITVQRLGGGPAFDPQRVAKLVSLEELSKMAGDDSVAVRQLVATILSEAADPKWTPTLKALVKDKSVVVAREAATGLGRIADESARAPLIEALKTADKDSRKKFLFALRDGIGGEGLVLALDTVVVEPEQRQWFQYRQLFDMLHALGDPRAGDALVEWVERVKPHKHWETEVGIALAEIGDIRGAKYIGARMGSEPKDLYALEKFWQADKGGHLTRTDLPRVVGARMLADLAVLHPDKNAQLLEWAEEPVMTWITSRPQPHANGLRFLAAGGSKKVLPKMRDWAFPTEELPKEGASGQFPAAFATAQSALRYLGWLRDESNYSKIVDQFDRKEDKEMDITQEGLMQAGRSMLGMCLRALAYGAANGLAQWGPRDGDQGVDKLMEFIEDKTWHEEARSQACYALAWVADDEQIAEVVKRVEKFAASDDPKDQIIGACYAGTLSRTSVPTAVPLMADLLTDKLQYSVRAVVGLSIGVNGLAGHPEAEKKLFDKMDNPELRTAAALALVMGGSRDTAARAVAMYAKPEYLDSLVQLQDVWFRAFGYWSNKDLDRGNLYRWVRNAHAIERVKIGDAPQEWATQRLKSQFDNLEFDNGPHSETKVVLRHRLVQAAKTGDSATKKNAVMTLKFMEAKGSLMALRHVEGETGELAQRAFHELMNPKMLTADEGLAELKKEQAAQRTK